MLEKVIRGVKRFLCREEFIDALYDFREKLPEMCVTAVISAAVSIVTMLILKITYG